MDDPHLVRFLRSMPKSPSRTHGKTRLGELGESCYYRRPDFEMPLVAAAVACATPLLRGHRSPQGHDLAVDFYFDFNRHFLFRLDGIGWLKGP